MIEISLRGPAGCTSKFFKSDEEFNTWWETEGKDERHYKLIGILKTK